MSGYAGSAAAAAHPAARLFEQYGDQLYRFCLGRMRSREEAEDALQSTFLRAHRALEKGVVPEYEAAWLYKIAHNVCLSRREAVGRHGHLVPLHDREDIELTLAAPETRSDELFGLEDALSGLSPKLRQAILLREWQGLSYAEIATAMDTSVSAVETLIFRARKELAAALEHDGRKPKRSRLIDFGALLSRFFTYKVATGAALLALGGAGVGTAVELDHHGSAPRHPVIRSKATLPILAAVTPAPAHRSHPVVGVAQVQPVAPVHHRAATVAPEPAAAVEPTIAAPPTPAAQPGETTVTPAVQPATTAVAPTPEPPVGVPPVEAPTVPLPPVQVPTVQVPTVSVPTLPVDVGH